MEQQQGARMHYGKRVFREAVFLCNLMLCNFIFLVCFAAPGISSDFPITVEPGLQARLASDGAAGCLIYFREKADLSGAMAMTWQSRGGHVVQTLQNTAQAAQARVQEYLDRHGVEYRSYWAANAIVVERASKTILDGLLEFPEIEAIAARRIIPLPEPVDQEVLRSDTGETIAPNIIHIKADQVWALGYDGAGMVVANIDGGVRYTHQALVGKYRGNLGTSFDHNYNWWDPVSGSKTPLDENNHGTHVMGIIVGDGGPGNRIGVAPGARWIACRGCNMEGCPDESLIACGQFMLAPTDLRGEHPEPAKRPHVINNSWGVEGGKEGDKWYWAVVGAWQAAGIYPVFANGNDGVGCGTAHVPASYPDVTAVGNIDHTTDLPSDRSNRGPGIYKSSTNPMGYPYLKPQVSAPGVNIHSSIASGDDAYKNMSGTSMATPHVAGLVALMLQAAPCLTYAKAEKTLMETASPIAYVSDCGVEGPEGVPNNATGWGVIDALKAVEQVSGICGVMGTLHGVVTSQAIPIAGATVTTEGRLTAITDEEGHYAFPHLGAGLHTVTVSRFGFYPESAGVAVNGRNTSKDFNLQAKRKVVVRGKVTDGSGAGWPLYAAIAVFTPGRETTVQTNPVTGAYSMSLFRDTPYTLTVSSRGYETEKRTVTTSRVFNPQDFELKVQPSCNAPGYEEVRVFYEDFEGDFPPPGWTASPLGTTTPVWGRNDALKTPNRTNGSGFCAQAGTDEPCEKWNAALVSPAIELPAEKAITLFYRNYYFSGGQSFEIWLEVTTDNGTTWHTLTDYTRDRGPLLEQVDLSGYAGKPIQIRWRYSTNGQWCSYYQQIDDVKLTSGCQVKAGGLVAGHVREAKTQKVLANIPVRNDASETTTTDDLGVYVLFSSAGLHSLKADPLSESAYRAHTRKVLVEASKVAGKAFALYPR
jgi:subtilisin family serine protease